jgi:hypothetical protein
VSSVTRGRSKRRTGQAAVSNVLELARRRRVSSSRAGENSTTRTSPRRSPEPNLRAPAINPAKTRRHRRCAARRAAFSCRPRVPVFQNPYLPRSRRRVQQHRHTGTATGRSATYSPSASHCHSHSTRYRKLPIISRSSFSDQQVSNHIFTSH